VFEHTTGRKAEQRLENRRALVQKDAFLQGLPKKSKG